MVWKEGSQEKSENIKLVQSLTRLRDLLDQKKEKEVKKMEELIQFLKDQHGGTTRN